MDRGHYLTICILIQMAGWYSTRMGMAGGRKVVFQKVHRETLIGHTNTV